MNTTYFRNMIAGNAFHSSGAAAFPAKYYVGLSSSTPTESGTGVTEPSMSGTGYARVEISNLVGPTNGVLKNSAELVFPKSLTEWFGPSKPATTYTIWDGNAANAHLLSAGALPESRIVQSNNYVNFPAESLTITVV